MKNLKGNSVPQIIIAVVVTALVVVGVGYYFYNSQIAELKNEVKKLKATSSQATTANNTTTSDSPTTVKVLGLSLTLPTGWSLDKTTTGKSDTANSKTVYFKVPDPKYNVVIPMNVSTSDRKLSALDKEELKEATTASGAEIYMNPCAPAIECYYLAYNSKMYKVVFQMANSNESAPENLDGVWFPSTTVEKKDTLNFLKTVK